MHGNAESTRTRPRYGLIYLGLVALTAIEVAVATLAIAPGLLGAFLLTLALAKAWLVAAYYMHLHGDSRLYTAVFVLPVLLLAVFSLLSIVI
jgi:caa(3)-type oxidase subunit IV